MTMSKASLRTLLLVLGSLAAERAYAEPPPEGDRQTLSLADCLALARENNPVASQAQERIRELVADYEATRSSFFPRVALTSYYQRLDQDRMPPGGFTPPGQRLFDQEGLTTVTARQTLFKGGKTYYGAQAATLGAEAQREESTRTADEILYTVTAAFFRLLEAKENLRVATESLGQRQAFAAVAEALYRAGNVTRLDFLRARSLVADAEQAEVEAGNAITQGRVILATAMGLRDEAMADALDVRGELPQDPPPVSDLGSLWQVALRDSPEIKKLDLSLAQSQALIKAARAGYFPEVNLQGAVGLRHQDVAGTKGEWLIGAFLDFPFFEGGMLKGRLASMSKQLLLFRTLLLVISVVILALVVYTFTMEKIRSIAVMKLIGAPNRVIIRLVMEQSLLLTVSAFAFGLVLIQNTYTLFPRTIVPLPADHLMTFGIAVAGGVLASVLGLWQALTTEPAMALGGG
jgi:outer membrane protein TolC